MIENTLQLLHVKGFRLDIIHASFHSFSAESFFNVSCDSNYFRLLIGVQGQFLVEEVTELLCKLNTIHHRHAEIGEDKEISYVKTV